MSHDIQYKMNIPFISNIERELVIEEVVLEPFEVSLSELSLKSRQAKYVYPRQLIMAFKSLYTTVNNSLIGAQFNQDHASVYHSRRTIADYYESNRTNRHFINKIKKNIEEKLGTVYSDADFVKALRDATFKKFIKEKSGIRKRAEVYKQYCIDQFIATLNQEQSEKFNKLIKPLI